MTISIKIGVALFSLAMVPYGWWIFLRVVEIGDPPTGIPFPFDSPALFAWQLMFAVAAVALIFGGVRSKTPVGRAVGATLIIAIAAMSAFGLLMNN